MHKQARAEAGDPCRHTALGVIRVRDGEIVRYDDYMNPIAVARLLGRTGELAGVALASMNSRWPEEMNAVGSAAGRP